MKHIKKPSLRLLLMLFAAMLMTACEKAVFDENEPPDTPETPTNENLVTLTFNIAQLEQTSFSAITQQMRSTEAAKVCSRITLALYQDDARVKYINQKADDDFGKFTLTVPSGNYKLLALAHSCDGNATTTALNKITFPNNKVTDTFYYAADINATADMSQQLVLNRIVAMVRFVFNDAIPENVARLKFYYTGGSSTLDGTTGLGCVNSKQTEYRTVDSHEAGAQFELFTLPHDKSGELKMTVSALDAADNVVKEMTFDAVPITVNTISEYSGNFFNSGSKDDNPSSASAFTLMVEDKWEKVSTYSF